MPLDQYCFLCDGRTEEVGADCGWQPKDTCSGVLKSLASRCSAAFRAFASDSEPILFRSGDAAKILRVNSVESVGGPAAVCRC